MNAGLCLFIVIQAILVRCHLRSSTPAFILILSSNTEQKPVYLSAAPSHVQLTPENEERKQGTQELCEAHKMCQLDLDRILPFMWYWQEFFLLYAHASSDMCYLTACALIISSMYKK